jgi:hypothetical protein
VILGKLIRTGNKSQVEFLLFSSLWVLIILITLLQDYYGARWGNHYFDFYESLAYKIFWLLFIPAYPVFSKAHQWLQENIHLKNHKKRRIISLTTLPVVTGLFHLFLFAYCLYAVSPLFNNERWDLSLLIKEELTTRLYIVIAVYSVLSFVEFRRGRSNLLNKDRNSGNFLTIRNGSKSTVIDINAIRFIRADSGYLEMFAEDRKHVIVDSLKHIHTLLDPEQFKRIHKSTIVNIRMIDSFKSRHNGDYDVYLKDGQILRLSRNYMKSLKGILL